MTGLSTRVGVPVSTNTPDSRSLSAWAKAENAARSFRTRSRLLQNHWPVVKHQGTGCQHPGCLALTPLAGCGEIEGVSGKQHAATKSMQSVSDDRKGGSATAARCTALRVFHLY